jgi:hypothetical protein
MSQTKEQIEGELEAYKIANPDWMTDVSKGQIIASYNNRLASLPGSHTSIICPACVYFSFDFTCLISPILMTSLCLPMPLIISPSIHQ